MRLLLGALVLLSATAARGDGGVVRLRQTSGPFALTVFTAPAPLRAGPIDVSVMLQRRGDKKLLLDAAVTLVLRPVGRSGAPIRIAATRAEATNKILYAAAVDLPTAGAWSLEVDARRGEDAAIASCRFVAGPALPPWRAYWPYFLLPLFAVGIFVVHQRLS